MRRVTIQQCINEDIKIHCCRPEQGARVGSYAMFPAWKQFDFMKRDSFYVHLTKCKHGVSPSWNYDDRCWDNSTERIEFSQIDFGDKIDICDE